MTYEQCLDMLWSTKVYGLHVVKRSGRAYFSTHPNGERPIPAKCVARLLKDKRIRVDYENKWETVYEGFNDLSRPEEWRGYGFTISMKD